MSAVDTEFLADRARAIKPSPSMAAVSYTHLTLPTKA